MDVPEPNFLVAADWQMTGQLKVVFSNQEVGIFKIKYCLPHAAACCCCLQHLTSAHQKKRLLSLQLYLLMALCFQIRHSIQRQPGKHPQHCCNLRMPKAQIQEAASQKLTSFLSVCCNNVTRVVCSGSWVGGVTVQRCWAADDQYRSRRQKENCCARDRERAVCKSAYCCAAPKLP